MEIYDVALFQGLNKTYIDEIGSSAKRLQFKKGESLFLGDELMHHFYVIVSGKVKTYQLNLQNAKEQTISILRSGDMFDIIVLLDGKAHDIMYEALDITEVIQLPITKMREWIKTNETLNKRFFPYLATQMRHVEELATDLSLHDTYHRLISLILQNLNPDNKEKYHLIHGLSHSEIAKLIGTVRHVVERHLQRLKKEDIIEENHRHLFVKDIQKLLEKL